MGTIFPSVKRPGRCVDHPPSSSPEVKGKVQLYLYYTSWPSWPVVGWTSLLRIWCDFDRASSLICGNKMPTSCNRSFYCRSYCLLNMFWASLCPSSGAEECYTVVAACGISCCGFSSSWSGVELRVMCPVCRMLVNQHPANRTHNPQLHTRPATWKTTARNTTGSNHCITLFSSWWWA